MGILAIVGVNPAAPLDNALYEEGMREIRSRYSHLDRAGLKALPTIKAYVTYYKKFGCSYHVLGQLESALSGKRKPHGKTGLLTAMFLTELEGMLLTAAHDLSALQPPLELKVSSGLETFRSISGRTVQTVQGDLMVCGGKAILSSILRGPDYDHRITAYSTDVVFTLYGVEGVQTSSLQESMQRLSERIRSFSPDARTAHLQVYER